MSVSITCYGGVNETGGNKTLPEDGAARSIGLSRDTVAVC